MSICCSLHHRPARDRIGFPTDWTAILLNALAAASLGFGADDVGGTLVAEGRNYDVVGIVEDYHFASAHDEIPRFDDRISHPACFARESRRKLEA